jgi:uncharacterized protein (TIGR02231 family)
MKSPLLPFLLATLSCAAPFLAGKPVDSKIVAVTVYADRAVVTRHAELLMPAGVTEAVFEGLPAQLDERAILARAVGSAPATLIDISSRTVQQAGAADPRVRDLEGQLRTIQAAIRAHDDQLKALAQQANFLERIKEAATARGAANGEAAALPSLSQWDELLGFYASRLGDNFSAAQTTETAREQARAEAAAIERQLAELRSGGRRATRSVAVRLETARPGKVDLFISYTVRGARWSPSYDLRVDSTSKELALGYFGSVVQGTGEDWTDVKLTLSTARPSLGGSAPELQPWRIGQMVPRPAPAAMPTVRLLKSGTPAESEFQMEGSFADAEIQTGLASATFAVRHPATVPSDNNPQRVPITAIALQGKLTHAATPKLLETAFLEAEATNGSEFPLLAGDLGIFIDGNYTASASLPQAMPGESFKLALGADEGLSVKRKLVNRVTENAGLVSRRTRYVYDFLITVQNNRKADATLVLHDQLPLPAHEKIEVKLLAPNERDLKREADGSLVWTLDLRPGEKREIPLRFTVEHPSDMEVAGL